MRFIVVLCFLELVACATTYGPEGYSGGYSEREVGDNQYLVTFRGNGYVGQSFVEEGAFRRAQELCSEKGYRRYQLISKDGATTTTDDNNSRYQCSSGHCRQKGGSSTSKSKVQVLITCIN